LCELREMGEGSEQEKYQESDITNLFNKISMCTSPPAPRLCHLKKWSHFDGYGFNLHAEKNKPGQFIGKIDANSPAEAAGLREGDRIVEVNGENINLENHKQVVQRIKAVAAETRLLVVDKQCDEWHKEQQVVVRQGLPYTVFLSSESADQTEVIDTRLQEVTSPATTPEVTPVQRQGSLQSSSSVSSSAGASSPSSSTRTSPSPSDSPDIGLNLNMTAKEMRERLGSQKRRDPRKDSNRHDMRRKFEMIQAL